MKKDVLPGQIRFSLRVSETCGILAILNRGVVCDSMISASQMVPMVLTQVRCGVGV